MTVALFHTHRVVVHLLVLTCASLAVLLQDLLSSADLYAARLRQVSALGFLIACSHAVVFLTRSIATMIPVVTNLFDKDERVVF